MAATTSVLILDRTAWDHLSDEEIVERVRAGETACYEILMRRYNQRLYRVALSILHDDSEAEDVMQEAYVSAYQHLDQFAGEAKFSTWLTKIAVYEALKRARRRRRDAASQDVHIMENIQTTTPDPERRVSDEQLRLLLEQTIDGLPDSYRSVFLLRVVEGLSSAETAACLEIGEEAVKTRLHRARRMLRKELSKRAEAVTPEVFPFHLSRCDRVVSGVFKRIEAMGQPN